jgi:hypothetical protein
MFKKKYKSNLCLKNKKKYKFAILDVRILIVTKKCFGKTAINFLQRILHIQKNMSKIKLHLLVIIVVY